MTDDDEIGRLRERSHKTIEELQRAIIQIAEIRGALSVLAAKVDRLIEDIDRARVEIEKLDVRFVSKAEHDPVARLTYGAAATILILVLTGLFALLFSAGRGA